LTALGVSPGPVDPIVSVASLNAGAAFASTAPSSTWPPPFGGLDADVIALQEVWCSGPADDSLSRVGAAFGYEVAELTLTERASRELDRSR
jgi:hypothetical protein